MSKATCTAIPMNPLVLGKMGSAYGIRGWLKMYSSTEKIESILNYQPWFIKGASDWQQISLENWKRHNRSLIIKISSIKDRETAKLLTNCKIFVDASQLSNLKHGEYYWENLIGCQVVNICAYQLGEVIGLMETGSNDVLVVKANLKDAFGIQERLIPFLNGRVIKKVDLATHIIEVDWKPSF